MGGPTRRAGARWAGARREGGQGSERPRDHAAGSPGTGVLLLVPVTQPESESLSVSLHRGEAECAPECALASRTTGFKAPGGQDNGTTLSPHRPHQNSEADSHIGAAPSAFSRQHTPITPASTGHLYPPVIPFLSKTDASQHGNGTLQPSKLFVETSRDHVLLATGPASAYSTRS
ncbi:hypothetical protein CALCODRAFT_360732 [Calocera cornea HHB12733]|uniref:Uncharacterized protein n=1 Tax=Calocera cornea HHB12733 TaxID=1353952 RepID=A0A165EMT3_9BASI|nr:hypothetical protein CALCODRAFT_360732 [Calocera cornea HHB12733]